jgi:hypothetical protein
MLYDDFCKNSEQANKYKLEISIIYLNHQILPKGVRLLVKWTLPDIHVENSDVRVQAHLHAPLTRAN